MKGNEIHYAYAIVACCCLIMGINVGLVAVQASSISL